MFVKVVQRISGSRLLALDFHATTDRRGRPHTVSGSNGNDGLAVALGHGSRTILGTAVCHRDWFSDIWRAADNWSPDGARFDPVHGSTLFSDALAAVSRCDHRLQQSLVLGLSA